MATTLVAAIVAKFDADIDLSDAFSTSGGLWGGEEPEAKTLPFAVLEHEGERTEYTFEGAYTEPGDVTFIIYQTGLAAAEALADLIKTTFDDCTLSLTNAVSVKMLRNHYHLEVDKERSQVGQQVWRIEIGYETELKRELPS